MMVGVGVWKLEGREWKLSRSVGGAQQVSVGWVDLRQDHIPHALLAVCRGVMVVGGELHKELERND